MQAVHVLRRQRQPAGVPLLRLSRPSWAARPDAASWHWVDSEAEAVTLFELNMRQATPMMEHIGRTLRAQYDH